MADQAEPQGADSGASGRTTLDIDALAAQLDQTTGADAWQVQVIREQEAQLYLIGAQVEAQRTVTNERARVRILNDHPAHASAPAQPTLPDQTTAQEGASGSAEQAVRGWATFTLLATEAGHPALVAARLRDGVFMAGLTDNQPYHLPSPPPQGFPVVQTGDPTLADADMTGFERELEAARATLEAAVAAEPGVRLSSAELYARREALRLRNSRGLAATSAGTRVFLDVMLIASESGQAGTGAKEAEVHIEMGRRRLSDLNIRGTIAAYAGYARDALLATTPTTHRGPVVISGTALPGLLTPLIFHTSAQARFLGISQLQVGQFITGDEPRGDRFSLTSDALYPFGMQSAPFDGEGVPATRVALVVDGVLRAHWAEQRYAQYLGVPATGEFATAVVEAGNWPAADLVAEGPVYEIVEFSFMTPDPISGDFVSEIRLGYRHEPDGRVTPIKGGTLSGNLFKALSDVRLSHETQFTGTYAGPAAIRFGQLTIAGE